ncbi:MAG: FAD-dependent oxidoreductase [Candidatus Hadarchaeales archaeon]
MIKYLIVGNSAAAVGAVEAIRQVDRDGRIVIVSKEPHPLYSRPLITYLLAGQIDESKMSYGDPRFYSIYNVEEVLGKEVVAIHPEDKNVVLDDGTKLSYQKLLLATGGRPIFPQVEGRDLTGVFTFTTLSDARKVNEFIEKNRVRNAVVVGGGLIGLKTAEALIARGIKVTIVELADKVLSATFDRRASEIVEKAMQERGGVFVKKNTVSRIIGEKKVEKVVLQDGTEVSCQLVIFAIGVTPNVELAKRAGIEVGKGILVDDHMQTNLPDIYAAGDVVEAYDIVMSSNRQIAIWPNAYVQGRIAGFNMAGKVEKYEGSFAMNSVEICGVPTISIGLTDPQEKGYEILERYDEAQKVYKKIVLKNDVIVGAIFVNKIDRAGVFTGLIKSRVNVHLFKDALLRDDFGLVWLPEKFRKHMVVGEGIEI